MTSHNNAGIGSFDSCKNTDNMTNVTLKRCIFRCVSPFCLSCNLQLALNVFFNHMYKGKSTSTFTHLYPAVALLSVVCPSLGQFLFGERGTESLGMQLSGLRGQHTLAAASAGSSGTVSWICHRRRVPGTSAHHRRTFPLGSGLPFAYRNCCKSKRMVHQLDNFRVNSWLRCCCGFVICGGDSRASTRRNPRCRARTDFVTCFGAIEVVIFFYWTPRDRFKDLV